MRKRLEGIAIGVALAVLVACGSQVYRAGIATGTVADKQFVQTVAYYNQYCPTGKLTKDQCDAWKLFMPRYKVVSDQGYKALKAGSGVTNAAELSTLLTNLATELALYYTLGDGVAGGAR